MKFETLYTKILQLGIATYLFIHLPLLTACNASAANLTENSGDDSNDALSLGLSPVHGKTPKIFATTQATSANPGEPSPFLNNPQGHQVLAYSKIYVGYTGEAADFNDLKWYGNFNNFISDYAESISSNVNHPVRFYYDNLDHPMRHIVSMTSEGWYEKKIISSDTPDYFVSSLSKLIAHFNAQNSNDGAVYVLFFGKSLTEKWLKNFTLGPSYYAYHSIVGDTSGNLYPFIIMPYAASITKEGGEVTSVSNFDQTTFILSHELAETVTDFQGGGWYNIDGLEIGDLCAGTQGQLKINNRTYLV